MMGDVPVSQDAVEEGCCNWALWWLEQRGRKIEELFSSTMTINPLMAPLVSQLHGLQTGDELVRLLVLSHLMIGHATGFGKLIDEKIIPKVFGAKKLTAKFRSENDPYRDSCFDDIDHVIERADGTVELLSLKASTWTIQLASAVQLNRAFGSIADKYAESISGIVVGVFYGRASSLSDKYDIARGVNRGADHDVRDLQSFVKVRAGRAFWSWLNDGVSESQDWVMKGLIRATHDKRFQSNSGKLLENFQTAVRSNFPSLQAELDEGAFLNLLLSISD